jgi:hypothetical protein
MNRQDLVEEKSRLVLLLQPRWILRDDGSVETLDPPANIQAVLDALDTLIAGLDAATYAART